MKAIVAYLSAGVTFAVLDALWLGWAVGRLYRPEIGNMLADQPRWAAAIPFYLLYVAGMVYLAIWPALREGSAMKALLTGAVLGLIAYATYDLTNMATLREWSWRVTFMDIAWGTFVTGSSSLVAYLVTRALVKA